MPAPAPAEPPPRKPGVGEMPHEREEAPGGKARRCNTRGERWGCNVDSAGSSRRRFPRAWLAPGARKIEAISERARKVGRDRETLETTSTNEKSPKTSSNQWTPLFSYLNVHHFAVCLNNPTPQFDAERPPLCARPFAAARSQTRTAFRSTHPAANFLNPEPTYVVL